MGEPDVIQVEYEVLADIAARFGRAAREHEEDIRRINAAHSKILFSWQGLGRFAFDMELGDFLRGLKRLIEALDEAEQTTREIIRTFREAELEAARLFMQPYGPPLPPGWGQPEPPPSAPDLFRAILEAYRTIIAFPKAVVIFVEHLSRHLTPESERLLKEFYDWVDLLGDNPARAARIALRWGRKIPEIGDLFTVWSGGIDVAEAMWHGRHEYTQGAASRGMAAMTVDATLAFLPAATELIGGGIGGYVGFWAGAWGGALLGFGSGSSGGPVGSAGGMSTGALVLASGLAALGDSLGGEVGRELGEGVADWTRSNGRRERAIDAIEAVLLAGGFISPNARWDWYRMPERDAPALRGLSFLS